MKSDSATLLTHHERCPRAGYWARDWERQKLDPNSMIEAGLRAGLLSDRKDFNIAAGEECYQLGADRGVDSKEYNVHSQVVHLSALADIICFALRKPGTGPWDVPDAIPVGEGPVWTSGAYLDPSGLHLRRVVLVSAWSEDRHYHEARSFHSLGEVCVYGLPMQEAVIVLGQQRDGRKHGPLAKGLLHPANKKLRFRRQRHVAQGFKDTWIQIWREDRDEISTHDWLEAMYQDGVLADCCFAVEIPVPERTARQRVLDLVARKLQAMQPLRELPEQNLSTCDWPVPCLYRTPCHTGREPQEGPFRVLD